MKQLLQRALVLALASAASLSLLSSVASLADSDRAALAQARQAQATLGCGPLRRAAAMTPVCIPACERPRDRVPAVPSCRPRSGPARVNIHAFVGSGRWNASIQLEAAHVASSLREFPR
jgi:hypothetical protein